MKKISLLVLMMLATVVVFAQNKLAAVEVIVTDFQNIPKVGEQILFIGKTNNKQFSGVSGVNGKFDIELEGGDVYEIKIKAVGEATDYSTVEIPTLNEGESYSKAILTLQFELPRTFTLDNVQFDSGKSTLKKESYTELNELIEYLTYKKDLKIEVAGHTDNVGEEEANMQLSEARANKVKQYLVLKGISTNRVFAKGYGETIPVQDNTTSEGRAKNRRTEVRIIE